MESFHVAVGDQASFSKTVSETDVYLFAGITGDFAPNHVDAAYMARSRYGRRMAHGALTVGYMSTASSLAIQRCRDDPHETPVSLGYDRIRFLGAVFMGDTITVEYTVRAIDTKRRRSTAEVRVTNQDGALVAVADHILKWVANA